MTMTTENLEVTPVEPVETVTSADTSTSTPAETSAAAADGAPKALIDAMFPAPAAEAPKTEEGAPVDAEKKPVIDAEGKPVAEEVKPDAPEELTTMPEDLAPKAQERFQRLANENKEVKGELDNIKSQIEPFRQTLQENKVTGEQFTMATQYIGLVNKGDLEGAYRLMESELRQLSLAMGKPLGGVDALADFPDLRRDVDEFQITEQRAMELARQRQQNQQTQQRTENVQRQQQTQQQQEQAVQQGVQAVDAWSREMAAKDLDFPQVEKLLQPQINTIIEGLPPHRWAAAVQNAYALIKTGAGTTRQTIAPSAPLRPTGNGSPATQPKNMFDAMFGGK